MPLSRHWACVSNPRGAKLKILTASRIREAVFFITFAKDGLIHSNTFSIIMNKIKPFLPDALAVVFFIVISLAYFFQPVTQGLVLSGHDHTAVWAPAWNRMPIISVRVSAHVGPTRCSPVCLPTSCRPVTTPPTHCPVCKRYIVWDSRGW